MTREEADDSLDGMNPELARALARVEQLEGVLERACQHLNEHGISAMDHRAALRESNKGPAEETPAEHFAKCGPFCKHVDHCPKCKNIYGYCGGHKNPSDGITWKRESNKGTEPGIYQGVAQNSEETVAASANTPKDHERRFSKSEDAGSVAGTPVLFKGTEPGPLPEPHLCEECPIFGPCPREPRLKSLSGVQT